MPTILNFDTFNHGVFSAAGGGLYTTVNGTPTRDTVTIPGTDPAAMKVAGAGLSLSVRVTPSTPPARGWMAFRFRCDTRANGEWIARMNTVGPIVNAVLQMTNSGAQFTLTPIVGAVTGTTSSLLSTGQWYWIEMIYDVSGTTYTLYWRIDGVDQPTTSEGSHSANTVSTVDYGSLQGSNDLWYYACASLGSAASTTDWTGPLVTRTVSPARVGVHNLDAPTSTFFYKNAGSDVAITSAEVDSYTYVDAVPFGGTDFVKITGATPTNTWYLEHGYAPFWATAPPLAIRVVSALQNDTGTLANVIGSQLSDDSNTFTSLYSQSVGSATPIYLTKTLTTKPSGGAWTAGAIDSLVRRWGFSNDASPAAELLDEMIEAIFPFGTAFDPVLTPLHPFPEQRFGAL